MANLDIPCTKSCNRKEHGDFMVSALTKRAVTDEDLCAFINYTCILAGSSKDAYGRTALHMAASCGRTDVCKWLVCQKQAKIDEKDTESGYTALHRSIFCGKIDTAVALIQLGANPKLLDSNDLTPLDHAMLDNLPHPGYFQGPNVSNPFIYVWGSNSNYTLGPNQARSYPEALYGFHKSNPHVVPKEVYMDKFHTVILSSGGEVFAFGHGQGGRLGIGTEKTVLEPTKVHFVSKIISCAIARDHCLFLTENNEVFACGLNTHHVLGIQPPPGQLSTPRAVCKLKVPIIGIASGRYHSVAWNSTAIYTWGLNGGQLGHDITMEPTQILPKLVTIMSSCKPQKIISVAASVGATAIATDVGDVYVLHEYQCRTIASKNLGITSVCVYGGKLAGVKEKREDLRVLVLTKKGNVLLWQATDPQLCRCTFSLNRLLIVTQVCLNAYGLVFITEDREIFNGKFKARKRKTTALQLIKKHFNHFLERHACVQVQVEKVARIYGASSVVCDLEGQNFAALHLNTSTMIMEIPEISTSTMIDDFTKMEVEGEVTYRVGSRIFPAHRYIVCMATEKLHKMAAEAANGELVITNVEPEIFHECMTYIYTGSCGMLKEGNIPPELAKFNITKKKDKINNPLRLLQEAAKKLGVITLYNALFNFEITSGRIHMKQDKVYIPRVLKYDRMLFPELHDVRIKAKTKSGGFVNAHKCILTARSEFFSNMFSMRWLQGAEIELPSTIECIVQLVDYLYTDDVDLEKTEVDDILTLMILADHILLTRLVELCEFALSKLITIKNVLRMMTIADMYKAIQLRDCCIEYACWNLALLLESRQLEQLDDELLKEMTKFYDEWNEKMSQRIVTPFSDAVGDDFIAAVSAKHPVKMDFNEILRAEKEKQKAHRRRNKSQRTSSMNMSVSDADNEVEHNLDDELDLELGKRLQEQLALERSVPVRIRAIARAHERIGDVCDEQDFFNLKLASVKDFPGLSASDGAGVGQRTPNTTPKQKEKMTRLSQKERKRLTSETLPSPVVKEIEPESPKNPWNMNFEATSPVSPTTFGNIKNIITEEKKQKENLSRIKSKLLIYTQMEDKALEDLKKFYNVENVFDEVIEVCRVDCGRIAAPSWVQK